MQQNFLKLYLRAILALIFFISISYTRAQIPLSDTLPQSEYLKFYVSLNSEDLYLKFTQVPDELTTGELYVYFKGEFGTSVLQMVEGENYSLNRPSVSSPYRADTVYFALIFNERTYHSIVLIMTSGYMNNISFGEGCYKLDCTPVQEPYMPSVIVPFLIDPDATYQIPGRKKIITGKKALNRYTPCELEKFEQVFFQDN